MSPNLPAVTFSLASWLGALVVVLVALARSRAYAIFRAVQLSIHTALAVYLYRVLVELRPAFWLLNAIVLVSALALIRPADRGPFYRWTISLPSAFYQSSTFFALPWALLSLFGVELGAPWLPLAFGTLGVVQSLRAPEETVELRLGGPDTPGLGRYRSEGALRPRPLRLIQITDPHLGPFMSVERLRRICERAVERNPDLIVLTGDFLTMESHHNPELLRQALEPLSRVPGRVFACLGNHDYEALELVRFALASNQIRLLVDDSALVTTEAGPVQVVGADFVWREREKHLLALTEAHPRIEGAFRLVLLHDPGAFSLLPPGSADLVLSGHTHGGQVGLVSLGLNFTFMRLFSSIPDHGAWARGSNRLYVHRGTGHYGFPVRLGVPAEQSLLEVHAGS
jgi:uncharacterized protein